MSNFGFWKISRNHLANIQSCQAAYASLMVFLGSSDETAWRHYSTRQATLGDLPSFLGFGLNCLTVTIKLRRRDPFPSFLVFYGAWVDPVGRKVN